MKFLKSFIRNLIMLVGVVLILALVNRWYLGGFSPAKIVEQEREAYTIAYIEFVGSYNDVGSSIDKVFALLSWAGIESFTGVGIYYDDPAVVAPENLKSDVGTVIDVQDAKKLAKNEELKTRNIPAKKSIVAEFPLKNSASYMAGMTKNYPAIKKYMQTKKYKMDVPIVELYDTLAKKIYYVVEILD